jgi:hypothetical protein
VSHKSQPLNRLLGWRLWQQGHVEYKNAKLEKVELLDQHTPDGYRYEVVTDSGDPIPTHQVVVRHNCNSALERFFPKIFEALNESAQTAATFTYLSEGVRKAYETLTKTRYVRTDWRSDVTISATPERKYDRQRADGKIYYRIKVWIVSSWALEHIDWVDYDLHPEYGTVQRRAMRMNNPSKNQQFRHWINTRDDFWIRVRCSDGSELGEWLTNAIEATPSDNASLKKACINDLRSEAEKLRKRDYRRRDWCDHVKTS